MSSPFAVIVERESMTRRDPLDARIDVYGPMDEDEADALAARLRREFDLAAAAVMMRGLMPEHARAVRR